MKNKKLFGLSLVALILAAILAACAPVKENTEEQYEEGSEKAQENKIVAWGEVEYSEAYDIIVDFPCNVISVDVKEGDEVGRGDLLAALDMTEYNETVKKLREQVESGKAALSDAIEDPSALEADIARLKKDLSKKTAEYNSGEKAELKLLESSLERAEKELSDAKEDLELNRKLHEEGAIATEELDGFVDAVEEKEKLRSDIIDNMSMTKRLLKEELDELSTELQYKQVQLDETRESNSASLERLSSSLAIYESDLVIMQNKANKPYVSGGSLVCSLERGIVQSISIINGSSLGQQNGNHKAMELIDADTIVVIAEVPEEFAGEIDSSADVKIMPVAKKNLIIKARVSQLPGSAIEKDGERIVRVEVIPGEKSEFLKPGYTADVVFERKK